MTQLQLMVLSLHTALGGASRQIRGHLDRSLLRRVGRSADETERGSLSAEQAVITGILVVAAVGLGVLITAVVTKYGSKIK